MRAAISSSDSAQALAWRRVRRALDEFAMASIQLVEKMLAEGKRAGPQDSVREAEADALAQHPEVQARVQQMMADHFERWVTEKIPALNGQTPLEAVRDPDGREKVIALVIYAERAA